MELPLSKTRTSHLRAGALRVKEPVWECVKKALGNCGMDREAVAKELSRLCGDHVSVHVLNQWAAEGAPGRRIPLEFAKALSLIVGDLDILRAALQPEFDLLDDEGKAARDYGFLVLENKANSKRRKELEQKALGYGLIK